ncbi:MAG: hypothetical protein GAK45_02505 [Pseudomonas citronellolis]|nr:MAG: hypothetical protein GAK45_02505 [Pseudomonas citronellolis]
MTLAFGLDAHAGDVDAVGLAVHVDDELGRYTLTAHGGCSTGFRDRQQGFGLEGSGFTLFEELAPDVREHGEGQHVFLAVRQAADFGAQLGHFRLEQVGRQTLQALQQVFEPRTPRRIDETAPQGNSADGPSFAEHLGDLGGAGTDQVAQLAYRRLIVLAQARLAGHQLAQHLGLGQQLVEQRGLVLQGGFGASLGEGVGQLDALGFELRILARQGLELGLDLVLEGIDTRFDIPGLARLAEHGVDLQEIAQAFEVATQGQAASHRAKAAQLDACDMELAIGIANQIEAGDQHGQEEQDADQAELHAEAQPVHQRDGRMEQALHGSPPWIFIVLRGSTRP